MAAAIERPGREGATTLQPMTLPVHREPKVPRVLPSPRTREETRFAPTRTAFRHHPRSSPLLAA